jgi:hypothetical protein
MNGKTIIANGMNESYNTQKMGQRTRISVSGCKFVQRIGRQKNSVPDKRAADKKEPSDENVRQFTSCIYNITLMYTKKKQNSFLSN